MQIEQYAADFNELAGICRQRNVAMQVIKTLQRRPWGDRPRRYATWYGPFDEAWAIERAIAYALGRPGVFINMAGDIHLLATLLTAADHFLSPPSEAEMQELMAEQAAAPVW